MYIVLYSKVTGVLQDFTQNLTRINAFVNTCTPVHSGRDGYSYVIVINYSDFGEIEIDCKVGKCNCFLCHN